jgi:hypothetical protein
MKKIIYTIAIMATSFASAQVGVGNTDPKATLDVNKASYATGEQAGIAVTQLTGAHIVGMTTSGLKAGTLVYATSTSGAIDSVGFWYYNGIAWSKVGGASATPAYQNIGGGVQTGDGAFTIADTTYFVIFSGNTAGTLTTPTPVAGKSFWVRNIGLNAATVAGQSINAGKMRAFVCDGTSWYPSNQ